MSTPRWLDRLRLRLRSLFRRDAADAELAREIALHLDEQTREHIARGMSPDEARAAARRAFGPVAAIEDQCRDSRRIALVQNLAQDLRYGLRSLVAQPMLILAATASIGVGVGATTLIFGLASELLMAVPSARAPQQLVNIRLSNSSHVSYREWRRLDESGALGGLCGYNIEAAVNWRDGDRTTTIAPLIVTANFFDVVGAPMALGRGFTAAEAAVAREPRVAVVSHGFWRRLGADREVIGRTVDINGEAYTVLGVLPAGLRSIPGFGLAPDIYLPQSRSLTPDLDEAYGASVQLVGRLKDDQSVDQGLVALNTVAQREEPRPNGEKRRVTLFARLVDGVPDLRDIDLFFTVLFVVAALVLAIACANVAGLNLARSTVRRREIAVRLALGATRMRLIQQLLVESLWLALIGTVGGLVLMFGAVQLLARAPLPIPIPLELRAPVDLRLCLFTLALLVLATLFSGLVPALQATRRSLTPALKLDTPSYLHRRWTLRGLLVTGQVALSMVLLVTSFLFLRNLARTHAANPGFDVAHSLVAQVSLVEHRYTVERRLTLLRTAVERIEALPGFERASFSLGMPLTIRHGRTSGATVGIAGADGTRNVEAYWAENMVGPGYFEALAIPLRQGRGFDDRDATGAPRVVVVNEEFARRHLAGAAAVGMHLLLPGATAPEAWEIVGVAGNGKYRSLGEDQMAALYFPYAQRPGGGRLVHMVARAAHVNDANVAAMTRAIGDLDRTAAVEVRPMEGMLAFAFLPSRVGAGLLGGLGVLGLTLAMAGLFAMLSYSVTRRTREIGVRMALGATGRAVARLVVGDAAVLVAAGLAIGLAAAAFVTKPLASFLVAGLSTSDPVTFASTALLFVLVSAAAAWLPTRRATRVDPVIALRDE